MSWKPCPTCKKQVFCLDGETPAMIHQCSPLFLCCRADGFEADDDWAKVYTYSAAEAAETYLEGSEDCDTKPGEEIVLVKRDGETEVTKYCVTREAVWQYSAEEVEDD